MKKCSSEICLHLLKLEQRLGYYFLVIRRDNIGCNTVIVEDDFLSHLLFRLDLLRYHVRKITLAVSNGNPSRWASTFFRRVESITSLPKCNYTIIGPIALKSWVVAWILNQFLSRFLFLNREIAGELGNTVVWINSAHKSWWSSNNLSKVGDVNPKLQWNFRDCMYIVVAVLVEQNGIFPFHFDVKQPSFQLLRNKKNNKT